MGLFYCLVEAAGIEPIKYLYKSLSYYTTEYFVRILLSIYIQCYSLIDGL